MRISYIRRMMQKSWTLPLSTAFAMGLLGGCGSQPAQPDPSAAITGTTHQRWVSPPAMGPEIATEPPVPVAANIGYNTEVASDGRGFLTVETAGPTIRGSRVDADGNVLDLDWLDFGPGSNPTDDIWRVQRYYPTVSFGAGHYLVLWSEDGTDDQGNHQDHGIRGRLVNSDGTFVGTQNFDVSGPKGGDAAAIWDGQHFVIAWTAPDPSAQYAVFVSLWNGDGTRVPGSERRVTTRPNVARPKIGHGSSHTFLSWEEYEVSSEGSSTGYSIWGSRISADGLPLDPDGLQLSAPSPTALSADIAVSDTSALVVFQTYDPQFRVRGTLVNHAGEVTARDFAISRSTGDAGLPSVVFDGTDFLVAWADGRSDPSAVYGVKVAKDSTLLSNTDVKLAAAAPRSIGFGSDHTNLAWNGSRYLLTFLSDGIQGSLLEKDLSWVNGAIPVTAVPNPQGYPIATWNGKTYVITWTDERDSSSDMSVHAMRIDPQGQIVDANGIVVSPSEAPAFSHSIGSVGDGSTLFLWSGASGGPKERMLSSTGTLGPVMSFGEERLMTVPSVASDGTGYLAVFATGDSSDGQVFGQPVTAAGAPGTRFEIARTTFNTSPTVSRGDTGYWVTYSNSGTWLQPVDRTGQVGAALRLSERSVWSEIVGGSSNTLAVWSELDSPKIQARFLQAGAFHGDPIEIASQSLGYGAAAAWDGSTYWLVWETEKHHLEGRTLSPEGDLGEISTWVEGDCAGPVLTSDGNGQLLLSYAKYLDMSFSRRVYSRLVGRGVEGSSHGADGGTSSGADGGTSSAAGGGASSAAGGGASSAAGGGASSAAGGGASSGAGAGGAAVDGGASTGTAGASSTATGRGGSTGMGGSTAIGGSNRAGGAAGTGGTSITNGSTSVGGLVGIGGYPTVALKCSVSQPGDKSSSRRAGVGLLGVAFALATARRRRRPNRSD